MVSLERNNDDNSSCTYTFLDKFFHIQQQHIGRDWLQEKRILLDETHTEQIWRHVEELGMIKKFFPRRLCVGWSGFMMIKLLWDNVEWMNGLTPGQHYNLLSKFLFSCIKTII